MCSSCSCNGFFSRLWSCLSTIVMYTLYPYRLAAWQVSSVANGSPAHRAGLQAGCDYVVGTTSTTSKGGGKVIGAGSRMRELEEEVLSYPYNVSGMRASGEETHAFMSRHIFYLPHSM